MRAHPASGKAAQPWPRCTADQGLRKRWQWHAALEAAPRAGPRSARKLPGRPASVMRLPAAPVAWDYGGSRCEQ